MANQESLSSMVQRFASEKGSESVEFFLALGAVCWKTYEDSQIAWSNMGHENRILFLVRLVNCWTLALSTGQGSKEALDELRSFFESSRFLGLRLMFTLTNDGRQFRCWYGVPESFGSEHVDSCGSGLLFDVTGNREAIQEYVDKVVPTWQLKSPVRLPNGVKIFGLRWD